MNIKKISNYFIVFCFILVLYVPLWAFLFLKDKLPEDTSENRLLATFPVLNLYDKNTFVEFPKKFDSYWNDHLPFRNFLKQTYEIINFKFFKISSSPRVIVGKNDGNEKHTWLFYNDINDGNPIGDIRGTNTINNEEMLKYYNVLTNNTEILKNKGIRLFYVVAPNKSTVYDEYLPKSINRVNEKSRNDIFSNYLKEKNVDNYVFLKDILRNSKNEQLLYFMLDTHWNDYGAFIGTREVLKKINNDFGFYDSYEIISNGWKDDVGDLKTFMNIPISLEQPRVTVKTNYDDLFKVVSKTSVNNNDVTITSNDNAKYDECIMLIGDSYRNAMIPYIANMYKKCIFMNRISYSEELLNNCKPDIIILEAVERYYMGNFDIVFN